MRTTPIRFLLVYLMLAMALPSWADDTADPALDLYYSANATYNRKLYPIAVSQYDTFLKKYGDHEKVQLARYGLGLSYFALKQYDKASPAFLKLLEHKQLDDSIDRGRLTLLHAQCLINTGQSDEALKRLTDATKALPAGAHRTGAMAAVIDQYYARSDWEKTLGWVKTLRASDPTPAQAIRAGYQEGMALYRLEKVAEAIKALNRARLTAKESEAKDWVTRIDQLLSVCHLADTDLKEAEKSLQAALAGLDGEEANQARFRLAAIKFQRGLWAESKADYKAFIDADKARAKDDPRLREAQFRIARCDMELSDNKQAMSGFQRLEPGNDEVAAQALLWRSRLYSRDTKRKNRFEEAGRVLSAAVNKPWYKSGFRDAKAGTIVADIDYEWANAKMLEPRPKWEEALKLLSRVQQRKPGYKHMPEVLQQRAVCEHKLERLAESLRTVDQFLKQYPDNALAGDVLFIRAENLYLLKRNDEASKAYRAFLDTSKEHAQTLAAEFRIAEIHHQAGQWEASNKLAAPLLAKAPEGKLFANLAFLVGENHFRQSEWSSVVEPMEAFLKGFVQKPSGLQKGGRVNKASNVDVALIELGIAYTYLNKQREAIDCFDMLIRGYGTDSPQYPLALTEIGKLLYEMDEVDRARQALTSFTNSYQDRNNKLFRSKLAESEAGRAYYYLGWVESAREKYIEAAAHFAVSASKSSNRKGINGVPLNADAALQQGIALINGKEYKKAADHLRSVAGRYKDHPSLGLVTYYTGLAYSRSENWSSATGYYKKVVDTWPDAPFADKALYEWAWCERAQKRTKQAVEIYDRLLEKYADSALATKVQSELADLNLDAGAQDEVIAKLTETIKKEKDPAILFELRYQLASAHYKKKDYEKAAPQFEALIQGASDSALLPSILFQAGEARLALTEIGPARNHYQAATQLKNVPKDLAESILLRLGETQNLTGEHAAAEKTYAGFLRSYPESTWQRNARYGYGFAQQNQEKYNDAIKQYRQLLPDAGNQKNKLDKWMIQARYQIGECYFNQQQYDKALAEFVGVDANGRGYPEWQAMAVLEIGRVHLAKGDQKDQATDRMKEVIKRFPKTKAATVAQQYLDEIRSGR